MSQVDGESIKKRRMVNGLTLRKLAELAEISPAYLSLIENGKKTPNQYVIERILNAIEKHEEIRDQLIIKELTALEAGRKKTDSELEMKLDELNEALRAYNKIGDMTLDETWEVMERIRYIVRECKKGE
jgi:transcriptional regulator with XRE-family HTH domain